MHGRIFVVDTEEMRKKGEPYECPWEDYEMARFIPCCDYVQRCEKESFESDSKWFASFYNLEFGPGKDVEICEIELSNGKFTVAQVKVKPLIEALKRNRLKRIKRIKN